MMAWLALLSGPDQGTKREGVAAHLCSLIWMFLRPVRLSLVSCVMHSVRTRSGPRPIRGVRFVTEPGATNRRDGFTFEPFRESLRGGQTARMLAGGQEGRRSSILSTPWRK